jgi:hypothetical protein
MERLGRALIFVKRKQYRRGILSKEGEPDVIGRGNRPAQRVPVDVPDLEILEEASLPAIFNSHSTFPFRPYYHVE